MSWLIWAVLFAFNWLFIVSLIAGSPNAIDKWSGLMIVVPVPLKWAAIVGFLRARFPGGNAFMTQLRLLGMTWEEHAQYRQETAAYLREKGILIPYRLLTAIQISGVVCFILRPAISNLLR
jgi:hypothetical protein